MYKPKTNSKKGEKVKKEIIADGPSTENGEMALVKNVLIAFATWEGYNYEELFY